MQIRSIAPSLLWLLCSALLATLPPPLRAQEGGAQPPLRVVATVPDLGALAREVGGDDVAVSVLAKPAEDAHFVEARPSFIKALSQADLFVQQGLDLESGWAPRLLQNARNAAVLPGARGFVDASRAIAPLEVPAGDVDRARGDVHPHGNPHYLVDPLNGLAVARLLRDRMSELRPAQREHFARRYDDLRRRLGAALVGEQLAERYDSEKLAVLWAHGRLEPFLAQQKEAAPLGGWLGAMAPYRGALVVADHDLWPYFEARFGIAAVAFLEPLPGIPPTTRHLTEVIGQMRTQHVPLILSAPYYDPRHARFVAEQTEATVVPMAHQTGSRPGTEDYLAQIDWNVRNVAQALAAAAKKP